MKPLHNKIIVERIAGETTTTSGLILRHTEEPDRARILAIGPDVTEVSVGEVCLLNWNAAIKAQGDTFAISIEHVVFVYEE
jgi:co-chaperonin GroES (HSP10)